MLPSANVRRGDRVVAKPRAGEIRAKSLARIAAQRIDLKSFNHGFKDRGFGLNEIAVVQRIIWASQ